jgi:hypothetical protein
MMQTPELNPLGWEFFGTGDDGDLDRFEASLRQHRDRDRDSNAGAGAGAGLSAGGVAAVFTEFPSNPLLKSPDLKR